MIDEKCPAKINLSLDIVGRREDGYHLVDMIMLSVGLCDNLYISRGGDEIVIECGNESVCRSAKTIFVIRRRSVFWKPPI